MTLRPLGLYRPICLASAAGVEASQLSISLSASLSSIPSPLLSSSSRDNFRRYATRLLPRKGFAGARQFHAQRCEYAQHNGTSRRISQLSDYWGGQLHQLDPVRWTSRRIDLRCGSGSQTRALSSSTPHNQQQSASLSPSEVSHRARQKLRSTAASKKNDPDTEIRPDASSRLSSLSTSLPKNSLKRKLAAYFALTKPHLSFLVVLTATTAYGLYPTPTVLELDPSVIQLPTLSTSTLTFLYLGLGTFLTAGCAATLNMLLEPAHDAKMSRTRNRPLVRGLMSKRAALIFAIITGAAGVTALYNGTNPTVAGLGALNIVLYAFVYTPLKRVSVLNTWVGAIVGGIPPLMGWTAAAGQTATTGHDGWRDLLFSEDSIGGWLLAGILYAWQFPHFNALSWNIREEYKAAGYRMLAWTNPARNGRVALRYSLVMFPLAAGLWYVGVVNKGFLVIGTAINAWMTREAYLFWKLQGAKASARGLFWASIWHLPILMVGCLVMKTGIWEGVWARAMAIAGYENEEDEYTEEILDEEEAEKLLAAEAARTR